MKNKARLTIEELKQLQAEGKLPITVECDDRQYQRDMLTVDILYVGDRFVFVKDAKDNEHALPNSVLSHYPSILNREPNQEWLYECLGSTGNSDWRFKDGSYPNFYSAIKRQDPNSNDLLKRKTGRKVLINMSDFTFAGSVENE